MKNPNCDNDKCTSATGEVRLLPLGKSANHGNLIVCRACWQYEIDYRRGRNRTLGVDCKFDLPAWETLKVYGQ